MPDSGFEDVVVGVVGTLQFDVFEYRMKNEYGVDLRMSGLPYEHLRLIRECPCDVKDLMLCSGSRVLEDFKGRKLLQNLSVTVNLFPGVLAMIAVYFVLKYLNLTNSYAGLIMVYAGSSGLGYLICKGFFDTIPISLREAAKLDGASDARVFFQVVLPMSKPILVYTIISSFMVPWTDFVMAKMILNSGVSADWTVAIGLYNMLQKTLINNYFALFCAGGVLVSIPISILFVIMQKFYVEGITSGADKG